MRRALVPGLVLAAAGACGGSKPEPARPSMSSVPTASDPRPRCTLTAETVRCTVYNPHGDHTVECVEPFLAVKATGDLLNGKRRWCSPPIAPGGLATFDALEGVRPIEVCGPTLDGCELRTFFDEDEPGAAVARIAAFAREIEAAATQPGKQPTMSECDAARKAWLASPELAEKYKALQLEEADTIGLFCKLHISRAEVACFTRARTEEDVEACNPDKSAPELR